MEQIQLMLDLIVNLFSIAFPFALIFWIVERITLFITSLITGKEVRL